MNTSDNVNSQYVRIAKWTSGTLRAKGQIKKKNEDTKYDWIG
jgi:hypothetical protein